MTTWTMSSQWQANSSYPIQRRDDFGPATSGRFDFTLLFEDTILSILPSVILLLAVPPRLWMLRKQRVKVAKSPMHSSKVVFLIVYAAIQATLLILWALSPRLCSRASVPAAALSFVSAIALLGLSHTEHLRSVRPSALINVYLLITVIFDIVHTRTLWQLPGAKTIAACFTSSLSIKLMMLISEAGDKRDILLTPFREVSPEVTSGIYSRTMFWWLNNLLRTGFKRLLTNNDLYPIDDEMRTTTLLRQASKAWKAQKTGKSNALMWAIMKSLWASIAFCILPRLFLIGFKYAQPFLISRAVKFASSTTDSDNVGWALTAAVGIVFIGNGISNGMYYHMVYRFVTSVRGSLITLIYAKTVDLSITALEESLALTLMATDTERICVSFQFVNELWAVPIEAGIALWLLYKELGIAFMGPAIASIVSTIGISFVAKALGKAQKTWIGGIQSRVSATASMLGAMKAVKMLGFSDITMQLIQNLRMDELNLFIGFLKLIVVRIFFGNSVTLISPLISFVIFVIAATVTRRTLDAANAFSALSIITLLTDPVNRIISVIPNVVSALACFGRIQQFLESGTRTDPRLRLQTPAYEPLDDYSDRTGSNFELQQIAPFTLSSPKPELLVAQNATFAWKVEGPAVVQDVSFTIRRSQFTFIIGPVGSGKSSLLKALLGEMPSFKGFVYSDTANVGFVDQTPWIQNLSLRDNIIGISDYEEAWYSAVVRACGLEHDIKNMANGHHTLVGSAGISLSGGQKQRIALARAVYSRHPLVMLDDVFSGLDAQTEELVFARLFGKQGLFRKFGTSVMLVTHAVHRLPFSDQIIVLNHDGCISEQGSYANLVRAGGYVESLSTTAKPESDDEDDQEEDDIAPTHALLPQEIQDLDREVAELNRQTGELAVYQYYFSSLGWMSVLYYLLLCLVFAASASFTQLVVTYWTAAVERHGNSVNGLYLGIYGALAVVALVSLTVLAWYFLCIVVIRSSKKLHNNLLKTVMGAPLAFFTSTDTGTTTNRFSQDINMVDIELPSSCIDLSLTASMAIMQAVLMCLSAGYFATTMPAVLLMMYVLQKYYLRTSRQVRLLDLEAKSPLYSHFIESLSGLATIRALGWETVFQERNFELLDRSQKPYYLMFCIQRWLALVLDLMVAGLAIILMAIIVKLRSNISAGYVGLALLNVMSFNQLLAEIIQTWTQLETSLGAISRLRNFNIQTKSENHPSELSEPPEAWPAHGAIEFQKVSASYTNDGPQVVKELSLSIRAGEKLGICGRSGSGKSSLITSLFRMLELTTPESTILIDGIDIATLPRQRVRAALNAIPQEPYFLKGTVRFNADPWKLNEDSTIISALSKVQLWDLVVTKGGLDADLDAEFFSHGQRQLFCLARALLRKSKILVLDEATSSVDVESDALMQRIIREGFSDCTILAVAHRLNTILDFDRIAVLKDGALKECDSPEALLRTKGSLFRDLYES